MKTTTRIILICLFISLPAVFTGCSSTKDEPAGNGNNVSSIPWNRPQKWEGSGGMGNMVQGSQ
ncbi:MAG: hypothetical protein SGI98_04280 [Verrucomicrobiota bacterium]|nr:hypothetical protein [Verrucomicrobiota bacterium]